MTTAELNRDVKRLAKKEIAFTKDYLLLSIEDRPKIDAEIRKELNRLYNVDNTFKSLNKNSCLILFKLNMRYRVIALHFFGAYIEIEDCV